MNTLDDAPTERLIPRAIRMTRLADVDALRGRVVYVAERGGTLSGPWLCWSAESFDVPDIMGDPMAFVLLTSEPDFWGSELLGADPTLRRVPVRFCVTVAL